MICVDDMFSKQVANGYTGWCHLFDDQMNVERLHNFAASIGLRRSWFQDRRRFPHYDVTPSKRKLAVKQGAKEVTWREMAAIVSGRVLVAPNGDVLGG